MTPDRSIATLNDFLHAIVMAGALIVGTIAVSVEVGVRAEAALAVVERVALQASVAIGTPFVQPLRKAQVE